LLSLVTLKGMSNRRGGGYAKRTDPYGDVTSFTRARPCASIWTASFHSFAAFDEQSQIAQRDAPITDEELHAYADGVLPNDWVLAVEEYLAVHLEAVSLVAAWREQAQAICERWGAMADESIPKYLRLDNIGARASGINRRIAAAAAVAFVVAVGVGWVGHDVPGFGRDTDIACSLADTAIEAHSLYVAESAIRSRCASMKPITCFGFRAASARH